MSKTLITVTRTVRESTVISGEIGKVADNYLTGGWRIVRTDPDGTILLENGEMECLLEPQNVERTQSETTEESQAV